MPPPPLEPARLPLVNVTGWDGMWYCGPMAGNAFRGS